MLTIINKSTNLVMMETEQSINWVLAIDRRLLVMKEAHENGIIRPSELAAKTGRSVQNISRAMHEMEEAGLVTCITPEKNTWKRYVLTDQGKAVFETLRERQVFD